MSLLNNNNNNPDFNKVLAKAKADGKAKLHHRYILEQQKERKRQQNQNKANRVFFGLNSENNFVPNPNSSPAKNNKKKNKNVSTYNSRKNKNKNLRLSNKEQQKLLNNNNNNPDFNKVLAKAKADGKAKAENYNIEQRLKNLRNIPKNPKNPNNNGKNNKTFTPNPLPLIRPGVESVYPLNTKTTPNTNNNNLNLSSINSKKPNLFNNNHAVNNHAVNNIIAMAGPRIQQKNTNRNPRNNTNFFNRLENSLQVQTSPYQNNMSLYPNATHILTHSSKNNNINRTRNRNRNRTKTRRPRNRRETFNNNLQKPYVMINGELVPKVPSRSRLKNTRNAITRKTKKGFRLFGRKVKNTSKSISKKTKKGFNSLKRSAKSIKKSFSSKGKTEEKRLLVLNKKIDELNDKIARYLLLQLRAQINTKNHVFNKLTSPDKKIPLNDMNCLINKFRMELVGLERERSTILPPNDETCVYQ